MGRAPRDIVRLRWVRGRGLRRFGTQTLEVTARGVEGPGWALSAAGFGELDVLGCEKRCGGCCCGGRAAESAQEAADGAGGGSGEHCFGGRWVCWAEAKELDMMNVSIDGLLALFWCLRGDEMVVWFAAWSFGAPPPTSGVPLRHLPVLATRYVLAYYSASTTSRVWILMLSDWNPMSGSLGILFPRDIL